MAGEDSPAAPRPSNRSPALRGWARALALACLAAGHERSHGFAIRRVLQSLLDASRAERAFVVRSSGEDWTVSASVNRRRDGAGRPSRTAIRIALSRPRPRLWDPADPPLSRAESVRDLALAAVLTAPLPGTPPEGVLVLDSRSSTFAERLPGEACEAFAALAGALLHRGATAPAPSGRPPSSRLVGRDPTFVSMLETVDRVAITRLPVLVRGESGTGKEAICRRIHLGSSRSTAPFLAVNCAAFPEGLLESELFGAERGAYTGADRDRLGLFRRANGGTLLLDEVGDMPLVMQGKLLRVLQESAVRPVGSTHEIDVDVRVIAATHRDLRALASRGSFRHDLLYRLAVLEVRVPPLRERLGDLPLLFRALAPALEAATGLGPLVVEPSAAGRLAQHDWPGNVRELEAALARALVRSGGSPIASEHLDLESAAEPRERGPEELERSMIRGALSEAGGSVARASRRIGWSRQKLYRRIVALGLERRGHSPEGETTPSSSSTFQ